MKDELSKYIKGRRSLLIVDEEKERNERAEKRAIRAEKRAKQADRRERIMMWVIIIETILLAISIALNIWM